MKGKIAIIALSIFAAFVFLSAGYSLWGDNLVIEGHIEVERPELTDNVLPESTPIVTETPVSELTDPSIVKTKEDEPLIETIPERSIAAVLNDEQTSVESTPEPSLAPTSSPEAAYGIESIPAPEDEAIANTESTLTTDITQIPEEKSNAIDRFSED